MKKRQQVVIIGAGHNGLIAACYLARPGREVLVLEQAAAAGGGSRTEERVPGYRFDTHSVAHNILNMTDILEAVLEVLRSCFEPAVAA
jgi:phytoene dehydrogenase-like protein